MQPSESGSPTRFAPTPVFVTGIGRSGTSALLKSLGCHTDFVAPKSFGEAPFIDHFARFLRNYEDDDVAKSYNLASYKVEPDERYGIFSEMIFRLHAVPINPERAHAAKYWAAKTSLRARTYNKLHAIFSAFKVIYIIRNGIEVINSSRHFAGFKSFEFIGLCNRWKASFDSNRFLELKDNCAVIRHQDLVEDPAKVLAGAFERIGLPVDDGPAQFISQNIFNSSFSEESKSTESKGVLKTRLADAWDKWSQEEQKIFLDICGKEMTTYGFAVPGHRETSPWTQPGARLGPLVADARWSPIVSARLPWRFSPIAEFSGGDAAAGGIRIAPEAIASRKFSDLSSSKIEIENRIGIAAANYCIHPVPSLGLMYIEVPKVACTSIKYLMQSIEMEARGEVPREFRRPTVHKRNESPLPAIRHLKEQEYAELMHGNGYFRFTIVRDPFERVLSSYLSKITKRMPQRATIISLLKGIPIAEARDLDDDVSFTEFLETIARQDIRSMDIHWRPQVDQMLLGIIDYDFIGRYERLADCLGYLKSRCFPKSLVMIPDATNATNSSSLLHRYYDERSVEIVQTLYADDFAILGYDKNFEDSRTLPTSVTAA